MKDIIGNKLEIGQKVATNPNSLEEQMKLIDLEPAWLSPDVIIFRCPFGKGDWLTCKRVVMSMREQYALVYEKNPRFIRQPVVMAKDEMAWTFTGNDFETITITPSIDASASGNWHGFITNGKIVGGLG